MNEKHALLGLIYIGRLESKTKTLSLLMGQSRIKKEKQRPSFCVFVEDPKPVSG